MKVAFFSNKNHLQQNHGLSSGKNNVRIGLETGNIYQVYGLIIIQGVINFYICDRLHQDFPVYYPADLFHVIDHHLSRFWIYNCIKGEESYSAFLFPEAFNDVYFFDKLTDGEKLEIDIFRKYKELMDLEFPDPSVTQLAQIGDEQWLICPDCVDAWESSGAVDALVRCPKCLKLFNNPRFNANRVDSK